MEGCEMAEFATETLDRGVPLHRLKRVGKGSGRRITNNS